jgi:hypothetical protein
MLLRHTHLQNYDTTKRSAMPCVKTPSSGCENGRRDRVIFKWE